MKDGRIPNDVVYGKLATGRRPVGRPVLRFKAVCKRDLKLAVTYTDNWEWLADDRSSRPFAVREGVKKG